MKAPETLAQFLTEYGEHRIAAQLGVSVRTVESWRRGERTPSRDHAEQLVWISEGALTLEAVYSQEESRVA